MAGAADDLTLKITTAIDEAALSKISRKVKDLTGDIEKLAAATAKFSAGLMGAGRVGTQPTPAGMPASQVLNRMGSSSGLGLADNLTKSVTNAAAVFRAAGEGSKGAFKMMNDALRDHVDRSDREIKKLVSSLGTLESSYNKIKSRQLAVGGAADTGPGTALGNIHDEYIQTTQQLAQARTHRATVQQQLDKLNEPTPDPGSSGGGGGGIFKYLGGQAQGFVGRFSPGGAKLLGAELGLGGAVLGGAAVLGGMAYMGAGMRNNYQLNNLNFGLEQPLFEVQRRAKFGQYFGSQGQAIMRGDVMSGYAQELAVKSGISIKLFANDYANFIRQKIQKETPVGFIESLKVGGGVKQAFTDRMSRGVDNIVNFFNGGATIPGLGQEGQQEIQRQMRKEFEATLSIEKQQQAQDEILKLNPLFNERLNSTYQNALGTLGAARAGGFGGGLIYKRNAAGVMSRFDQMGLFNARMIRGGFDPSEGLSMIQRMQQAAGRGNMHQATEGMLSMVAGGLGNAPELFGIGSQFGTGGALIKGIQGLTGAGGIDPVAATQLFGAGAGAMTSGNYAAGQGIGFMGALADAAFGGSPGMDLRLARQTQSGLGAMAGLGGGIDPLQQALVFSAAINAAPNSGYTTHKGLADLFKDPASLMEIIRTKKVPQYLQDRGINLGMIQAEFGGVMSTQLSRYASNMGTGTNIGAEAAAYKRAGGMKQYLAGINIKERRGHLDTLAEAVMDTMGLSREQARGMLALEASTLGMLPSAHGRGAHRSDSLKTMHGVAAATQADLATAEAEAKGKESDTYTDEFRKQPGRLAANEHSRVATSNAARFATTDAAIDNVTKALQQFVQAISQVAQGSNGPVRAQPKAR